MLDEKRRLYVFIVKLWAEKSENAPLVWRGSLVDIQTEKKMRVYFQDLRGLVDLIARRIMDGSDRMHDE